MDHSGGNRQHRNTTNQHHRSTGGQRDPYHAGLRGVEGGGNFGYVAILNIILAKPPINPISPKSQTPAPLGETVEPSIGSVTLVDQDYYVWKVHGYVEGTVGGFTPRFCNCECSYSIIQCMNRQPDAC